MISLIKSKGRKAMATMYPAIEASMGNWTYYIVKLKVGDLAREVSLSSDVSSR